MKIAEQVTFGGSGLERRAELRGDVEAISALWLSEGATVLPIWRGKPLIAGHARDAAGFLPTHTEWLSERFSQAIYLGDDGGIARFAVDISDWEPEAQDLSDVGQFVDPSEQKHPDCPPEHRFVELRSVMTHFSRRDGELLVTAKAMLAWHSSHGFCAKCGQKSEMAMAGWQRNCEACGTPHFPRTDPVVIMLITHGNSVLMGRSPGWPEGMYSLLAGFVEPGETIEAAVRREVVEEAGINVGAVSYLSSQPWPFPNSLMFGCWGEALNTEITIDLEEIEDAFWVTREDMMTAFAGEHPKMKPARVGSIAHFILSNWLADRLN
ncbi:NAD(+) diphosphatase [Cochlodiniinecator piscidefendens]|uniref:NAD(+) diphosphatase n=1 Tax=Cochlodiniinecator piscidefendens TaxID=2715756 RepID=UPI00140B6A02|nr:NAD(+) diphosphatase [Cochlodiniinecator piscidefendens]